MHGSHSQDELRDLCRRCGEGDETAFAEVYAAFSGKLYGTALRMLKRPDQAEDATQETFLTFLSKASTLQPTNLGGWLHRVVVNECLDRIRRHKRRPEDELIEEIRPARPRPTGPRLDLEEAVEELPEGARMVFLLHDVEGFKHREVADLLDISEGTSKSQLFRARETLRGLLAADTGGTT